MFGSVCVVNCVSLFSLLIYAVMENINFYFSMNLFHRHLGTFPILSVQSLSCGQLFETPWTPARQASLSITNSWSLLKFMSIELVMLSNISSSVVLFPSCLQSFSAWGSFQMSQFLASGGQSIGVSASVLPMNIQSNSHIHTWLLEKP